MKMINIFFIVLALFAFGSAEAQIEFSGTKLRFDDTYHEGGWVVYVKPKLAVGDNLYSLARSSNLDLLCKALGFTVGAQSESSDRIVYPAGLKAVLTSNGQINLADETEGCFWNVCLSAGPILIPINNLYCQ